MPLTVLIHNYENCESLDFLTMSNHTKGRAFLAACALFSMLLPAATANNIDGLYCPSPPQLPTNLTNTTISGLPPSFFPSATGATSQNPVFLEEIRYTLNLYPIIIDGKAFSALDQVFTATAVANYSSPLNVLTPLSTIKTTLAASLAPVNTQHSLTTQFIEISPGACTARSVSYYTAAHFGVGIYEGEVLYA
ncbi:hypothetical protein LTR78_007550 [Recurvomyces mirabilis]|uniref:SnoaL-like domain-containing protein n=1 Tax=Recurvomyces mirabilis TaxID=574656 RepID=A0AAE0WJ69_9PEZI|nr:hypothetical protein LTR78_007550 [Recurvomyces mirabilis]KAK5159938.1 hypothetical protein LTS14_002044 [Recurvomyces mirabilis]